MKNFFLTVLALLVPSFVLAQVVPTPLTDEQAAPLWAAVDVRVPLKGAARNATVDLPRIEGAAIVASLVVDEMGRKYSAVVTLPGTYLIQGELCSGVLVPIGQWGVGFLEKGEKVLLPIIDTNGERQTAPTMNYCRFNLFKVDGVVALVSSSTSQVQKHPMRVANELVNAQGEYVLVVAGDTTGIDTVVIGRDLFGRVERGLTGDTYFVFPADGPYTYTDMVTLTVCDTEGECEPKVFQRQLYTGSSGKG